MGSCLPCCSPTELTRQYTVSKMDSPGREEMSYFLHNTPGMHGDLCSSTQSLLSIVSCPGYLSSTLNLISGVSWHPSPCAQSIRNVWAAFCLRKITQGMCCIDCLCCPCPFPCAKAATLFIYWVPVQKEATSFLESLIPNFSRSNGSCSLLSWFSILTLST